MIVPVIVVAIFCIWAAINDWISFKIKNKLTIPLILSGFAYHFIVGYVVAKDEGTSAALINGLRHFGWKSACVWKNESDKK